MCQAVSKGRSGGARSTLPPLCRYVIVLFVSSVTDIDITCWVCSKLL